MHPCISKIIIYDNQIIFIAIQKNYIMTMK